MVVSVSQILYKSIMFVLNALNFLGKPDTIHRADFRISDICNLLGSDWEKLAKELGVPPSDIELIKEEYPNNTPQQATVMFRLWLRQKANKATGNINFTTFY